MLKLGNNIFQRIFHGVSWFFFCDRFDKNEYIFQQEFLEHKNIIYLINKSWTIICKVYLDYVPLKQFWYRYHRPLLCNSWTQELLDVRHLRKWYLNQFAIL